MQTVFTLLVFAVVFGFHGLRVTPDDLNKFYCDSVSNEKNTTPRRAITKDVQQWISKWAGIPPPSHWKLVSPL
jgi:hypothetical protein